MYGGVRPAASGAEDPFLPPPLALPDARKSLEIEALLSPLQLDGAALARVMEVFSEEMDRGLAQQPSSLQMENTYVPELPDGSEEGVFLALDLGGTNFRVLLVELRAGEVAREDVKQYHIDEHLRLGPGAELFQFLADCVADFVRCERLEDQQLPLGFTFSFPMVLHSISSGNLTTWTKSFKCPGMEGVDVVALLQECLRRAGARHVTVVVLLNDTTGTLVSAAKSDHRAAIGVIFGTGSNGCYLERAARVSHWEAAHERVRDVIVDIEWGAFGDNGCLEFVKSDFDREVDARSLLVNSFTFEKYIGGKYMGEIVRTVLARLAARALLGPAPPPAAFTTTHISRIEEECSRGGVATTLDILEELTGARPDETDARVVQHVCRVVSNRAAQLVSACVATLLVRMEREFVSVAVDGSVFKRHPRIWGLMNKYIAALAPAREFKLVNAEDGSGKGAALTAAVAVRINKQNITKQPTAAQH